MNSEKVDEDINEDA